MNVYESMENLGIPYQFPIRMYWQSSLEPRINRRQVHFDIESNYKRAESKEPIRFKHRFQIPCDTILPEIYQVGDKKTNEPCTQKELKLDLIR